MLSQWAQPQSYKHLKWAQQLGTHITYHIPHKEDPLLCYTVPQATLPSSALQDGHRKVQLLILEILAFRGFIKHTRPLHSQSPLDFSPFCSPNTQIRHSFSELQKLGFPIDFGVANAPKFAPRFMLMDSPLDFFVPCQIWTFLVFQNLGSLKVAIFWFFLTVGSRFWMGMMLGRFTMGWGENEATSHEVEWLLVQAKQSPCPPIRISGLPMLHWSHGLKSQPPSYNGH